MFAKHIIYLKNLLFFQFVLYFFSISLIILEIKSLKTEHEESSINKQNTQEVLTEETLKLYSVAHSKDEILNSYKKYDSLNISEVTNCLNYKGLVPKIQRLSEKYKLAEPIDVSINNVFFKNNIQAFEKDDKKIRINNYSVNIKYAVRDLATFLQIFQEIYSYMPSNTMVALVRVRNEELLTPKTIHKLSPNQPPNFIYAKLTMYIRELVSE
jgi:hypothetical protein